MTTQRFVDTYGPLQRSVPVGVGDVQPSTCVSTAIRSMTNEYAACGETKGCGFPSANARNDSPVSEPMSAHPPNSTRRPVGPRFQFDLTIDGRQVKFLNIIDEYTRECLAIAVDHSIGADIVVGTLARLSIERGRAPAFVRFDNGPEFVSHAVADWCDQAGVGSVFIDPGVAVAERVDRIVQQSTKR